MGRLEAEQVVGERYAVHAVKEVYVWKCSEISRK